MINSMTGYGRSQTKLDTRIITVELRSVNNRFLDCNVRCPKIYAYLEEKTKARILAAGVSRGKIDVYIGIEYTEGADAEVRPNSALIASYLKAFEAIAEEFSLPHDITVGLVARMPDAFTVSKVEEDRDELWNVVAETLDAALAEFCAMRAAEGARMAEDVLGRVSLIEEMNRTVKARMPQIITEYRTRLLASVKELLGDRQVDESRIITEVALFADRIATDEETVRLDSHIAQMRAIFEEGGPIGRKLDFLLQEMNREVNTIGSKSNDLEVSRVIVEIKSQLEKIREQIQNIE
jgi:uncharacterized protein (TIGR00255 family)